MVPIARFVAWAVEEENGRVESVYEKKDMAAEVLATPLSLERFG